MLLDRELKNQLEQSQNDLSIIEDQFYKHLSFGTGGMRGELGPGTNRTNIYTVRRAAEGVALYLNEPGEEAKKRGIVIAYDSRHKSREFALEAAKTAGKYGIQVYLFDEVSPTPLLSFAVRHLNAFVGIVITASHNPPIYNGFKLYGEDGGQITPAVADKITEKMNQIEDELTVSVSNESDLINTGKLVYIGSQINNAYLEALKLLQLNENVDKSIHIVYTPLHGTGLKLITEGLRNFQYPNVTIVEEQKLPDPNFSTVQSPNPEEPEAFTLAFQYGKRLDADILMATDPDDDRLGVAVNNYGQYEILTGNQLGALLLYYLLQQKQKNGTLPNNGAIIKTIVTSEIGIAIANDFGLTIINTLTGFKYIGAKIKEFEQTSEYAYLFGYEESYGYLIGDFVRDKDAVQTAVFTAEAAAYYKSRGMTLYDGLIELFEKYGYYKESLQSFTLKGKDGIAKINTIMENFRQNKFTDSKLQYVEDYLEGKRIFSNKSNSESIELPKENVLKYVYEDGSWFCLRPSGTEPKIKFYFGVVGSSLTNSEQKLNALQDKIISKVLLNS